MMNPILAMNYTMSALLMHYEESKLISWDEYNLYLSEEKYRDLKGGGFKIK